ncbi:Nuclear cap-binding protein subunit 2 [Entamoeba marina]
MADLYYVQPFLEYFDRKAGLTYEEMQEKVNVSSTFYIGNLNKKTTDKQLMQLFSTCGRVKTVIMGVDERGEQCEFCFVEFETREEATLALKTYNLTQIDGKFIRMDWDYGFVKGRELKRRVSNYHGKPGYKHGYGSKYSDYHSRKYADEPLPPRNSRP